MPLPTLQATSEHRSQLISILSSLPSFPDQFAFYTMILKILTTLLLSDQHQADTFLLPTATNFQLLIALQLALFQSSNSKLSFLNNWLLTCINWP